MLLLWPHLEHSLTCSVKLADCSCLVYNDAVNYVSNVKEMLCSCLHHIFDVSLYAFGHTAPLQLCQASVCCASP